jgi:environmental stress-induced protein Ves
MPWKNGRGTTLEIAAEPKGAKLDDPSLLWRLSSAPVTEPGPFSAFPGLARFLALTEGKELGLSFKDRDVTLRAGDVYHFRGEEQVSAKLTDGPVKDIGLLYRPDRVKAQMDYLSFKGGVRSFALRQRAVFFYAVAGEFQVGCFPGGTEYLLAPGHAIRVDANGVEQVLVFEPKKPRGALVSVEINWLA